MPSISSCDNRLGLGLRDHSVHLYNHTTIREVIQLSTGKPIRDVKFAIMNACFATVSSENIRLWNITAGTVLWSTTLLGQALAIEFKEDDMQLMLGIQANTYPHGKLLTAHFPFKWH